jgi:superfamily II DNA or RNA helicase
MTKTALRTYQKNAVSLMENGKNAIIILPTGSGKTLIASHIAESVIAKSNNEKVLFLVPTRLLVEQQAAYIQRETSLHVVQYMGGCETPVAFQILVSTPLAYLELNNNSTEEFSIDKFGLVVFDEVHHAIKKHPYKIIAGLLTSLKTPPKILGLTA